ncbi:MAG: hypothetical protein NTZ40_12850, partial [Cyanobacteria bacterium]|nr:hypothetical protein [Cyanobacteriota bacterium]
MEALRSDIQQGINSGPGLPMQEGTGPDWQLRYEDLEPWYGQAEALYRVHGEAGQPFGAQPVQPFQVALRAALERQGLHPYRLPLSVSESAQDPSGDAELFGVDRALGQDGFELRQGARVLMLHTDAGGKEVRGVEAQIGQQRWLFKAHQVVLAAGAIGSAV